MSNMGEKRKKRGDDGDRNGPSGRGRFSKAQRGRHGGRGGRGGGHGPSARSARLPKASVSGPGIFLSCTRQKERKAAFELIDILEEVSAGVCGSLGDRLSSDAFISLYTDCRQNISRRRA